MSMRAVKWITIFALAIAAVSVASAKKKEKTHLPAYVLKAQTVLVVILPDSGEPIDDITANRKAQEEVEKAFLKWGRYRLRLDPVQADRGVGVRTGTGKSANTTTRAGRSDPAP